MRLVDGIEGPVTPVPGDIYDTGQVKWGRERSKVMSLGEGVWLHSREEGGYAGR